MAIMNSVLRLEIITHTHTNTHTHTYTHVHVIMTSNESDICVLHQQKEQQNNKSICIKINILSQDDSALHSITGGLCEH
jgi:hypothetical protein